MYFKYFSIQLIIILFLCDYCVICFEPLTIGAAALGSWVVKANYGLIKDLTFCQLTECCTNSYVPGDFDGLQRNLTETLFGQHFVLGEVIKALKSHYEESNDSKKPLVMIFNGTPGTGKNFVADRIADYMYKEGVKSKFVYRFYGRQDFSEESKLKEYQTTLKRTIIEAISRCPRSLFIFDEVDKMPAGIFDFITNYLDHNQHIDGENYRQAIYIFLSNAGGVEIANKLAYLMEQSTSREDTKIYDFERVLEITAYNENGGLQKTNLMSSSLVDLFIPFLPLQRMHVEKCIQAEFNARGKTASVEMINEIAEKHIVYEGNFSTTGCKRLSKKVGVYADDL